MSYIDENKAAWEEAFDNRRPGWGENNHLRLKAEKFALFDDDMKRTLEGMDLRGKTLAQFCCNNGRELLSLMDSGASAGVGFDIAENIIAQARETAGKAGITNCEFVACNILDIPESYYGRFDLILFTVGSISWFEDLALLFAKTASCLKAGGVVLINHFHPMMAMLPKPWDSTYDPKDLRRVAYSYFNRDPWVENRGRDYMSGEYASKTFTDFPQTMSDVINALGACGLKTFRLDEHDYDVGMTDAYDGKGFPLSFTLIAEKSS
ncbi:MAG: class I SAM-dependent methyltransferase [Treponema sp.]|nr:class I SAM-dependent methyltransferase [Treponema sp.]